MDRRFVCLYWKFQREDFFCILFSFAISGISLLGKSTSCQIYKHSCSLSDRILSLLARDKTLVYEAFRDLAFLWRVSMNSFWKLMNKRRERDWSIWLVQFSFPANSLTSLNKLFCSTPMISLCLTFCPDSIIPSEKLVCWKTILWVSTVTLVCPVFP